MPGILLESATANLDKTELLFYYTGLVLDDGLDSGENTVGFLLLLSQFATFVFFGRHKNGQEIFVLEIFDWAAVPVIATISDDNAFFTVQAVFEHEVIGDLGCGAFNGLNQATFGANADMGLYSEVPLVAFLGLTHLGVALLVLVLGSTRRNDQGGTGDRVTLSAQPLLAQNSIDLGKDGNRQFVLVRQMAETQVAFSSGITFSKYRVQRSGAAREHHAELIPSLKSSKPLLHVLNTQLRSQRASAESCDLSWDRAVRSGIPGETEAPNCFRLRQKDRLLDCLPAWGKSPVSSKLNCFIDFICFMGFITTARFSEIMRSDIYISGVSLMRESSSSGQ